MGPRPKYVVDPADPRAPSDEVWAALTEAERSEVVASLPSEFDLGPPEGDIHRLAIEKTKDPLEGFFERTKRRVYISSNLTKLSFAPTKHRPRGKPRRHRETLSGLRAKLWKPS